MIWTTLYLSFIDINAYRNAKKLTASKTSENHPLNSLEKIAVPTKANTTKIGINKVYFVNFKLL